MGRLTKQRLQWQHIIRNSDFTEYFQVDIKQTIRINSNRTSIATNMWKEEIGFPKLT
jgi:hypothetical protein